jgi:hypothetical protein
MNIKVIRQLSLAIVALIACLTFGSGIARADSVTYTFTGAGAFVGSNFTYVSSNGFLPLTTGVLTPTTASDLFVNGSDAGQFSGFSFTAIAPGAEALLFYTQPSPTGEGVTGLNPAEFGDETLVYYGGSGVIGSLSIQPTVPEIDPTGFASPLVLIAGLVMIIRVRHRIPLA